MSDDLKWWEIERAVWERGPAEKARRAVLAQLAKHADAQGVTFVGQPRLAERSGFSLTTVKRAIAALEFEGWIRVEERSARVETPRGFEKKGNQYLINLVKLGLQLEKRNPCVSPCDSDNQLAGSEHSRIDGEPEAVLGARSRPTGQRGGHSERRIGSAQGAERQGLTHGFRRDEGNSPAPATRDDEGQGPVAETRDEGANPARAGRVGWSKHPPFTNGLAGMNGKVCGLEPPMSEADLAAWWAEESSSARSHSQRGEVSLANRRGLIGGAPLINQKSEEEQPEGEEPPYAPPCGSTGCASQEQPQKQRQKSAGQCGGSARVLAFPRQRGRDELRSKLYASVRQTLDGEEAALWDETERVLVGCGVVPRNAGRKLREAISLALEQEWRIGDEPLAAVADHAIAMWMKYISLGMRLRVRCGLMQFFKSGEWLHEGRWRYDAQDLWRLRRGPG